MKSFTLKTIIESIDISWHVAQELDRLHDWMDIMSQLSALRTLAVHLRAPEETREALAFLWSIALKRHSMATNR